MGNVILLYEFVAASLQTLLVRRCLFQALPALIVSKIIINLVALAFLSSFKDWEVKSTDLPKFPFSNNHLWKHYYLTNEQAKELV